MFLRLLLSLLELLLFLLVFLLEPLELLLLFLLDLLPSSIVGMLLESLLLLLDLLLLDSLALLVLLLAELVYLLLMLLLDLGINRWHRVWVRPRVSRTVVVRSVSTIVCGRISRLIALGRPSRVAGSGRPVRVILHIALRLAGVAIGSRRFVGITLNIALRLPPAVSIVVLLLAGPIVGLAVLRCPGSGRRSQPKIRANLFGVSGLRLTHLRDGWRPAAIGLYLLLLPYERDRSRRWRRLGHHGAFLKPSWRPCRSRGAASEYASLLGRNRWGGGVRPRRFHVPSIDLHHVSSDRLRRPKILL